MLTKRDCLEAAARGEGCLGRAADDEPVFVLRAQDLAMAGTIIFWASKVQALSERHSTKAEKVLRDLDEIRAWQATHPTKVPD